MKNMDLKKIMEKRCDSCYRFTPADGPKTCAHCRHRKATARELAERRRLESGPVEPAPLAPVFQPREEREATFPDRLRHARIHWHTIGENPNPGCDVCALWTEIVRLRRLCAALGAEPAEIDREYPETEYGPETDAWNLPVTNGGRG